MNAKKSGVLRKPSDFRRVFRGGRRFSSPHFVLYVMENSLPSARLGVSIAKAHFKLATRRNRLRRVARELFRNEVSPCRKGFDFVMASRAGYPGRDLKEALREITFIFSKFLP